MKTARAESGANESGLRLIETVDVEARTERPECQPACHCVPSTTWESRRRDGTWDDGFVDGGVVLEQRTCLRCGSSQSREVAL